MNTHPTVQVLVVGAGPVGLTTSILLGQLGVSHRIVERRSGLHTAPQAHVVASRSMEIFRAAGLDERALRAVGTPPQDMGSIRYVHTLAGPELGVFSLLTPEGIMNMLASTPAPSANISQFRLEPVLAEASSKIEFDCSVETFEEVEDGVAVTLRDAEGGSRIERFAYLLACDGAGSGTRRRLGIEMIGPEMLQKFVMADVQTNLRDVVGDRTALLYWHLDPYEPATVIVHDVGSRAVFMLPVPGDADLTREEVEARVAGVIGCDADFRLLSANPWVMTAQVAERYGSGRVFLLGDAAHRFPPTGGLGMNTGIADAFNLTWKIRAVLEGLAEAELLATYECERRPPAQANSDLSHQNFLRVGELFGALELHSDADRETQRAWIRALPESKSRQAKMNGAIEQEIPHYKVDGLDWGQTYLQGALLPDGSPPAADRPTSEYTPSTRPGSRLPHAWIGRNGEQVSTHDLPGLERPLLLLGNEPEAWTQAARGLGFDIACVDERELTDPEGAWASLREVGPSGALLVRPDRHIAFRAKAASQDPRGALIQACRAMFWRVDGEAKR